MFTCDTFKVSYSEIILVFFMLLFYFTTRNSVVESWCKLSPWENIHMFSAVGVSQSASHHLPDNTDPGVPNRLRSHRLFSQTTDIKAIYASVHLKKYKVSKPHLKNDITRTIHALSVNLDITNQLIGKIHVFWSAYYLKILQ